MYIFELIFNAFKKKKQPISTYNPVDTDGTELEENSEDCEHLFMPLDSTNEYFACKYCGLVVHKSKLKNKNIFENKSF